jgi:hypothetical protein
MNLSSITSSLIMKHISSESIISATCTPINVSPFIRANNICIISSLAPWVHCFSQDNIQQQQHIRVESREQEGIIGHPFTINNSVVTIVTESEEETPPFDISVHSLSPLYILGDNVKACWSDSHGMVILVNEDQNWLVYIDMNLSQEVGAIPSRLYISLTPYID